MIVPADCCDSGAHQSVSSSAIRIDGVANCVGSQLYKGGSRANQMISCCSSYLTKGDQEVEKEGKAEFKVFGKTRTISGFNKPTAKPSSRKPESTHSSAKTSTDSCPSGGRVKRAPIRNRPCRDKFECGANSVAPDENNPAAEFHVNKSVSPRGSLLSLSMLASASKTLSRRLHHLDSEPVIPLFERVDASQLRRETSSSSVGRLKKPTLISVSVETATRSDTHSHAIITHQSRPRVSNAMGTSVRSI